MSSEHHKNEHLSWKLPENGSWVYDYHHRREVKGTTWFSKVKSTGERQADLIVSVLSPGDSAQVVMTNILDQAVTGDTSIARPLEKRIYPVVTFDRLSNILTSSAPPTFRYFFVPELSNLIEGVKRETKEVTPLKSGTRKVAANGNFSTCWEETKILNGRKCAVLVSDISVKGANRKFPWSLNPPVFRGRSVIHFDIEAGRLLLGYSTSETEQTIRMHRIHQTVEMSFRLKSVD